MVGSVRRRRSYPWVVVLVVLLVSMLSGCMEALQDNQSGATMPPSALPSVPVATGESVSSAMPEVVPTSTELPPAMTAAVTETPVATMLSVAPSPTVAPPPPLVLPTRPPQSNQERWRDQQVNRVVLEPMRVYTAVNSQLWWYDPINQQHVVLGTFMGDFMAQATFTLRHQQVEALEVPYQVNQAYGLTALSPALIARIQAAGAGEWIETYVVVTPDLVLR